MRIKIKKKPRRCLMAIGTLAAYGLAAPAKTAFAYVPANSGSAKDSDASDQGATLPLRRFDIDTGPLDAAIAAFEKASGVNVHQPYSAVSTITSQVKTNALSVAACVLDTVKVGRPFDLTGGIRWDCFDTDYKQSIAPASAFSRVDAMPTWRGAVVYKPVDRGSVYFDYGTSFNPSAESLSLSAGNANLPPEKNRTYEFGTKWDLPATRLSFTAAVFRTDKVNAREPDPNNPLLNVLAGNQRVDGVQTGIRGRITRKWEVTSSYANLDSRVVSSNYYPASIGAQLANVPRNTFNIWNEYRLPWRWEIGGGGNYVSSRTASSTVPLDPTTGLVKQVPSYWVFNAMLKRPINEHMDFQINVNNTANRYYYDELHPGHIVLGPGRSALVGIKFKF